MASGDCVAWPPAAKPAEAVPGGDVVVVSVGLTNATVAGPVGGIVSAGAVTAAGAAAVAMSVDGAETVRLGSAWRGITAEEAESRSTSLSRNESAMAGFVMTVEEASVLAKSERRRTLAATALSAGPPGGTVPHTSARGAVCRIVPTSLPNPANDPDPPLEPSEKVRAPAADSVAEAWAWDRDAAADAKAASCAARAAAATKSAGVSGSSNFESTRSSAERMQAVGTFVMPSRRVASGLSSTSTQTGSKQAVMRATASSLASVVRSSVVLAELQLAVKMASTGR